LWLREQVVIATRKINSLNAELNPICCLLALLGAHHFLHVSRIRVKVFGFIGTDQLKTKIIIND